MQNHRHLPGFFFRCPPFSSQTLTLVVLVAPLPPASSRPLVVFVLQPLNLDPHPGLYTFWDAYRLIDLVVVLIDIFGIILEEATKSGGGGSSGESGLGLALISSCS